MEKRAHLVVGTAEVVRNMFRRLSTHPQDPSRGQKALQTLFGRLGRVFGFALAIVRWPVLAVWGADKGVQRLASLLVLFIGAWVVVGVSCSSSSTSSMPQIAYGYSSRAAS